MNRERALQIFNLTELTELRELSDKYYQISRATQLESLNPDSGVREESKRKQVEIEAAYVLLKKEFSEPEISQIKLNDTSDKNYSPENLLLKVLGGAILVVGGFVIGVISNISGEKLAVKPIEIRNEVRIPEIKGSVSEIVVSDLTAKDQLPAGNDVKFEVVKMDLSPEATPKVEHYPTRDHVVKVTNGVVDTNEVVNKTSEFLSRVLLCDTKRVEELIAAGESVQSFDERGDSALALAIRARCLPMVKLLIKKGANVNSKSSNGFTPYVWARLYKLEEISKILEQAGADKNDGWYWWRQDSDRKDQWVNNSLKYHKENKKNP